MASDQASSLSPSLIQHRIGAAVVVLIALLVCAAAYLYGRTMQAEIARNMAIAIEDENHTFCAGLGFTPATEVFVRCADGLVAIRSRHEERISRRALDL
jgi:predicted Na+-dependent transporter